VVEVSPLTLRFAHNPADFDAEFAAPEQWLK
jgi:hypothetical protein